MFGAKRALGPEQRAWSASLPASGTRLPQRVRDAVRMSIALAAKEVPMLLLLVVIVLIDVIQMSRCIGQVIHMF